MTVFPTLTSHWSKSHQTTRSRTLSPHLFVPTPCHPLSLMLAPAHLFSLLEGWPTLLSALHAPPWFYQHPLLPHYYSVTQMSSSLTNLTLQHHLRQWVTYKHLLRCHLSPITCQSIWVRRELTGWRKQVSGISQATLRYLTGGPLCRAWTVSD